MKKLCLLFFYIASFLWSACGNKQDQLLKKQEENVIIIKKLYEHFNKHDWKKMAELYTNPADFKDPSLGTSVVKQSHKQTIEKYKQMGEMSPDLRDDIIQIYPSGEQHVIVEFVASGKTPFGPRWELPICTIYTIENGKITKDHTYYDGSSSQE